MDSKHHLKEILKKIGLTESEATLYLAISQHPHVTLTDLKKITGFSLATVYRLFESLKEKHMVISSAENWRKNVQATSLRAIAERLSSEQRKLGKIEAQLRNMDNIQNMTQYATTKDPIKILTDRNELIEHCYRILNKDWDHITCYGSPERLIDLLGNVPEENFVKIRAKKGKSCSAIFTECGDYTREILPKNMQELRNVKLRIDDKNQESMVYTYGNEVTVWSVNKELGERAIVIQDPALVKVYANAFQGLWR